MKQFVIIGNSAAGIAAIEAIRQRDKQSKIAVISDEDYPAYCRCLISYYLSGEVKKEKVLYRPESFYKENNIELLLNKKVTRIDPAKNRVVCQDKSQIGYDALLIATGASAKFPDIKGIKKRGVFGFRSMKDVLEIEGLLPVTKAACVLGGGLVGLKAAYALKKRNVSVKVVIKSSQVLSQMLDYQAAGFVQKRLEDNGIELLLGTDVAEIIGEGDIRAVKLDSGKALESSLVISAKGVTPNMDLAQEANLEVNRGIIANGFLQTSMNNIYTAGDVCEGFDLTLGRPSMNALWTVAVEQGKVAGANMAQGRIVYDGSLGMNSIEFFGLPVVSLGIHNVKPGEGFEELKRCDEKLRLYKKFILKDNKLMGAVMVGDIVKSGVFLRMIRQQIDLSSIKEKLFTENFGFPDIIGLIKEKEQMYV